MSCLVTRQLDSLGEGCPESPRMSGCGVVQAHVTQALCNNVTWGRNGQCWSRPGRVPRLSLPGNKLREPAAFLSVTWVFLSSDHRSGREDLSPSFILTPQVQPLLGCGESLHLGGGGGWGRESLCPSQPRNQYSLDICTPLECGVEKWHLKLL